MTSNRPGSTLAALAMGVALCWPLIAQAQDVPSASDAQVEVEPQGAIVNGFRSATFGMTMDEVRAVITEDFGVSESDITEGTNRAERTQLLSVTVPDLLEGGGQAQVSYVFGYQSQNLIQVGVSWNMANDPDLTEDMLYANTEVLTGYFLAAGYVAETITSGTLLENGVLVFRGEDTQGHATMLLLQGAYVPLESGEEALEATSLALLYAQNAENPDVFVIVPGQF